MKGDDPDQPNLDPDTPGQEGLGYNRGFVFDISRWRTGAGVWGISLMGPAGVVGWNVDEWANEETPIDPPLPGPAVVGYGNIRGGTGVLGIGGAQTNREHGASIEGFGSGAGVAGINDNPKGGIGVLGIGASAGGEGVKGVSTTSSAAVSGTNQPTLNSSAVGGPGVLGIAGTPAGQGLQGDSLRGEGVRGESSSPDGDDAGVAGYNHGAGPAVAGHGGTGPAIAGFAGSPTALAGFFSGKVTVSGELFLGGESVCVLLPTLAPQLTAGMVVVLDANGNVTPCTSEYDPTVVGIVPGLAGLGHNQFPGPITPLPSNDTPGLLLGTLVDNHPRSPGGVGVGPPAAKVAVLGTAWCFADATADPIRPGDLLTTSAKTGLAKRLSDPTRASGAVIGRALTALSAGTSEVRVLINPR
jgi:hypothetical protein